MKRPLASTRPLSHRQPCLDCEGLGVTRSEDFDEHGSCIISVRCEACLGVGELTDCAHCDEPMSPVTAEENNGYCGPCRAAFVLDDMQDEIARVRRQVA